MAKPLLTDALWKRIEPLLPPHKPRRRRFPGRKPIDDRKALTGILFVLKTGINWEDLPQEMGCGCGMTCWRRLRDWNQAGVWQRLHETLLAELHEADRIDWARALIDSSFVRARGGGGRTGPSPVDRRKRGTKHQIITDAGGIPLVADTTRQCPRRQSDDPAGGCDSTGARQAGAPTSPAGQPVWRPRLRLGSASPEVAPARHPSVHRATADAAWERAGNVPLVRGADAVVVAQLREAASSQG
jgi:transposase